MTGMQAEAPSHTAGAVLLRRVATGLLLVGALGLLAWAAAGRSGLQGTMIVGPTRSVGAGA